MWNFNTLPGRFGISLSSIDNCGDMSQNVAAHQAKELDAQGVYSSASAQDMHSGVTGCIDESRNTHTSWARPCEKSRPAPPFLPLLPRRRSSRNEYVGVRVRDEWSGEDKMTGREMNAHVEIDGVK